MPAPRVLVVCQHYWPESFRIKDICDFLIEKGCSVDVLCGIPNYPKGKFFDGYGLFKKRTQKHDGVTIRRVAEIPRGNNSSLRIFLNYISFPIASLFHIPRLLTKKYDKIFIYQLSPVMMSIAGIIVGKLKKTETTMYVLDLWPENLFSVLPVKNRLLVSMATKVSHWHYKKVDKLVVLSEMMKTRLAKIPGVAAHKITVLPQACEKLYENDIPDKVLAKKYQGKFNIVFAGNISPAQSFETIVSAAKKLMQDGIKDINWIIVGDGMSRKWLEETVASAGLSEYFTFEGIKPVADIPRYTPLANVLIGCLVKSDLLEATIPAKVMSYIAAGKPLVLAMDGEVQGLVNKQAKCGFTGPAGDSQAFYENIKKIYEMSPKEQKLMGERGREYHFKYLERNIILNKLYNFMFA